MHPALLPLDTDQAALPLVGGKAANLARLARAGYPVPPGFLITVSAYQDFIAAAGIEPAVDALLARVEPDQPSSLEETSAAIRALFTPAAIPSGLADGFRAAYRALGSLPVAVRSSATAEDLPDMSFAGQQDTFLNVQGEDQLIRAVVDCWSSLWTARAIGYRARQGIPAAGLALAVVVQVMVPAEASGVMFTANPLTGLRSQTIIDATLGLGEALVSGRVEPDHYVVDPASGAILEKKLGAKAVASLPQAGGGVEWRDLAAGQTQALPDRHILALAEMGRAVAASYDFPQDIEWALADDHLYLLQSRPITSLFPLPSNVGPDDLRAMFSFGAVQGMLDPITPLGQDTIGLLGVGFSRLYGYTHFTETTVPALRRAGERLWLDITALLRNPLGSKMVRFALAYIEPSTAQALDRLSDDPRLRPTDRRPKPATIIRMARAMLPIFSRVFLYWVAPKRNAAAVRRAADENIARFKAQVDAAGGSRDEKLAYLLASLREAVKFVRMHAGYFVPAVAGGMSAWAQLRRMAGEMDRRLGGGGHYAVLAMQTTRGVENNVTTEMDLILWQTARVILDDPQSKTLFLALPSEQLARRYQGGDLPAPALAALDAFMRRYGLRGLAEIDLGRPRWLEEPIHVMEVLGSYLRIDREDLAPDVVFARGRAVGLQAAAELAEAARRLPGGWFKARLARIAARRVHYLMGLRELPKFIIIRLTGTTRMALLESGREYVADGILDRPDDLFFLSLAELEALSRGEHRDWKALVAAHRAAYAREKLRRQIPRLLLSDGRAFYEGMDAAPGAGDLSGEPVSPGQVEGLVRVVLDPRGASLQPGEILVCPGTDPSWTPLFLAAGALVMEVGGMMTHGAVVAREYGLPAVVGVHQATTRLTTGQRVRVNGSNGEITLLD